MFVHTAPPSWSTPSDARPLTRAARSRSAGDAAGRSKGTGKAGRSSSAGNVPGSGPGLPTHAGPTGHDAPATPLRRLASWPVLHLLPQRGTRRTLSADYAPAGPGAADPHLPGPDDAETEPSAQTPVGAAVAALAPSRRHRLQHYNTLELEAVTRFNRARRAVHRFSTQISTNTAKVSPTWRHVRHGNREVLQAAQEQVAAAGPAPLDPDALPPGMTARQALLGQLDEAALGRIWTLILDHVDDAFLDSAWRNTKKALLDRPQDQATRAAVVAQALDLQDEQSALNRTLERLAPELLRRGPVAALGRLERDDLMLRLACGTIDDVMRPTDAEADATARLVVQLQERARVVFEAIHLECMQEMQRALAELGHAPSELALGELSERMAATTVERIEKAQEQLFKEFRKANGAEFGYTRLGEVIRLNCNMEYYRSLFVSAHAWATVLRAVPAFSSLAGAAALPLSITSTLMMQYLQGLLSQASVGATGAAAADLRPFDPALSQKALTDPAVYRNQKLLAKSLHDISLAALQAYQGHDSSAARDCLQTAWRLKEVLGYQGKALDSLAPLVHTLTDYADHMLAEGEGTPTDPDHPVPAPVRVAHLLQLLADDLPPLHALRAADGSIGPRAQEEVLRRMITAINRRAKREPPADVDTIAARAQAEVARVCAQTGVDRERLGRALAPDEAAMHAGGVAFMALIQRLIRVANQLEQSLYQSKNFMSAQYKGLRTQSLAYMTIQLLFGAAAAVAVPAVSAVATPVAGVAAGLALGGVSYLASSAARDAGARAWYLEDTKTQTHSRLHALMRAPTGMRLVPGEGDHQAAIRQAVQDTHKPLYQERMKQLTYTLQSACKEPLIDAAQTRVELGANILQAVLHDHASRPERLLLPQLMALQFSALHRMSDSARHQAVLQQQQQGVRVVDEAVQAAQALVDRPHPGIDAAARTYRTQSSRIREHRESQAFREQHSEWFPDAAGKTPALEEIKALRARMCRALENRFAAYRHSSAPVFSTEEWKALAAALSMPQPDDATSLWLSTWEQRLQAAGQLEPGRRAVHLEHTRLPAAQERALRLVFNTGQEKLEQAQSFLQTMTRDWLALQTGRFDEIEDPLRLIRGSLENYSDARHLSRLFRTEGDARMLTFTRGTTKFLSQLVPVNLKGAATLATITASGAVAIWQAGAGAGEFTILKMSPEEAKSLAAQGIQVPDWQLKGIEIKVAPVAATATGTAMNALQPETNQATFYAYSRAVLDWGGGFPAGYGPIELLGSDIAQHTADFPGTTRPDGSAFDRQAALGSFLPKAALAQVKKRVNTTLPLPPNHADMDETLQRAWTEAREASKEPWNARLGHFHPRKWVASAQYSAASRGDHAESRRQVAQIAHAVQFGGTELAYRARHRLPPLQQRLLAGLALCRSRTVRQQDWAEIRKTLDEALRDLALMPPGPARETFEPLVRKLEKSLGRVQSTVF